jgi:hypothetical protein
MIGCPAEDDGNRHAVLGVEEAGVRLIERRAAPSIQLHIISGLAAGLKLLAVPRSANWQFTIGAGHRARRRAGLLP